MAKLVLFHVKTHATLNAGKTSKCVMIEQELGKSPLYLVCCHHILKIIDNVVFKEFLGLLLALKIQFFKWFKGPECREDPTVRFLAHLVSGKTWKYKSVESSYVETCQPLVVLVQGVDGLGSLWQRCSSETKRLMTAAMLEESTVEDDPFKRARQNNGTSLEKFVTGRSCWFFLPSPFSL